MRKNPCFCWFISPTDQSRRTGPGYPAFVAADIPANSLQGKETKRNHTQDASMGRFYMYITYMKTININHMLV